MEERCSQWAKHVDANQEWAILERMEDKHVKAKFFCIKDRVDKGEIKVIDCPAEEMWADILPKPLQGVAFRMMRAVLMNCLINYEDEEETPLMLAHFMLWIIGRRRKMVGSYPRCLVALYTTLCW